jgi:hypothetical protein
MCVKVHETRSQAHAPSDESRIMTRKQKVGQSKAHEGEQLPKKKAKNGKDQNDSTNGKSEDNIAKEYEEFCKAIEEHLSVEQMREILDMNDKYSSSGSDGVVATKWQVNPSLIENFKEYENWLGIITDNVDFFFWAAKICSFLGHWTSAHYAAAIWNLMVKGVLVKGFTVSGLVAHSKQELHQGKRSHSNYLILFSAPQLQK